MDITVIIGFFGGAAMLLLGQALEGGNIGQLLQVTAANERVSMTFTKLIVAPTLRLATSIDLRNAYSASFDPSTTTTR